MAKSQKKKNEPKQQNKANIRDRQTVLGHNHSNRCFPKPQLAAYGRR
jgi:hypothetical protein